MGTINDIQQTATVSQRKKVILILVIYGVLSVLVRLSGLRIGLDAIVAFGAQRKTEEVLFGLILYHLLPLFMAFYAYRVQKPSGTLMFYSVIEILLQLPNLLMGWVGVQLRARSPEAVRFFSRPSVILCFTYIVLMVFLLWMAVKLARIQKEDDDTTTEKISWLEFFALPVGMLCYFMPFVPFSPSKIVEKLTDDGIETVHAYETPTPIQTMAASPDGKLLALGCEGGLYIWDVEEMKYVWSDDKIGPYVLKFSESGKYLAAGGFIGDKRKWRGAEIFTRTASDLAVYELESFRRLPGFDMSENDPAWIKDFYDLAFTSGDQSLMIAWVRNWNKEQFTDDERSEIYKRQLERYGLDRKHSEKERAAWEGMSPERKAIAEIIINESREVPEEMPTSDIYKTMRCHMQNRQALRAYIDDHPDFTWDTCPPEYLESYKDLFNDVIVHINRGTFGREYRRFNVGETTAMTVRELICTKIDVLTGDIQRAFKAAYFSGIGSPPFVPNRAKSIKFFSQGRYLSFFRVYGYVKEGFAGQTWRDNLVVMDLGTMDSRTFILGPRYFLLGLESSLFLTGFDENAHHGHELFNDHLTAYFIARDTDINGIGHGGNVSAYVFLEMDLSTGTVREHQQRKVKRKEDKSFPAWSRLILLQGIGKAVLLGRSETLYDYGGMEENSKAVSLRVVDISGVESSDVFNVRHDYSGRDGTAGDMVWLGENKAAVGAMVNQDGKGWFAFVNLDKRSDKGEK